MSIIFEFEPEFQNVYEKFDFKGLVNVAVAEYISLVALLTFSMDCCEILFKVNVIELISWSTKKKEKKTTSDKTPRRQNISFLMN